MDTSSSVLLNAKQIMLQCQSIINFVLAYTEWIFIKYKLDFNDRNCKYYMWAHRNYRQIPNRTL